jgi:chromate transporter
MAMAFVRARRRGAAVSDAVAAEEEEGTPAKPPATSLPALFARFLSFGLVAFGGPVAQIAMLQRDLVERERWIDVPRFRRVLGIYQALPGPEAHELCCYFGHLARGRLGAIVAGLGFMLPGFLLIFALAALYFEAGLDVATGAAAAVFAGMQPAVAALIVRAVHRIAVHAVTTRLAFLVAAGAFVSHFAAAPFWVPLLFGGAALALEQRGDRGRAQFALVALFVVVALYGYSQSRAAFLGSAVVAAAAAAPPVLDVFLEGLRAGLLTFGGAYTAIPFLRESAVREGGWLTDSQFLDGIALSGVLPAPLIIFGTFVGYGAAGPLGAIAMTAGIFLPAFGFTLLGHTLLERLVDEPRIHAFLDGVTAAVVGIIAATALDLGLSVIDDRASAVIFVVALIAFYLLTSRAVVPLVMLFAALAGLV